MLDSSAVTNPATASAGNPAISEASDGSPTMPAISALTCADNATSAASRDPQVAVGSASNVVTQPT